MAGSAPSCPPPGPLLTNQSPPAPAGLGWGRDTRSLPTLPGREILQQAPLPCCSRPFALLLLPPCLQQSQAKLWGLLPTQPQTPSRCPCPCGTGIQPRPLTSTRHRVAGRCQSKGSSPLCQPWVQFSLEWCLRFDGRQRTPLFHAAWPSLRCRVT